MSEYPKHKLQTNGPHVIGVIRGLTHAPSANPSWPAQIAVDGVWDALGNKRVYLPIRLQETLQSLGVSFTQTQDGGFAYRLPEHELRVDISKEEIDGGKSAYNVVLANGSAPAPPQETQPEPNMSSAAPKDVKGVPDARQQWAELDAKYATCLSIAKYQLDQLLLEYSCEDVRASANTLFMYAQHNLPAPPPAVVKALTERANQ